MRTYIAIDLKSFYASVECVERGLDPLTTNLVVADASRTEKTICLAVSPSLKAYGIPGRARLFEVVQRVREVNAERLRAWKRMQGQRKYHLQQGQDLRQVQSGPQELPGQSGPQSGSQERTGQSRPQEHGGQRGLQGREMAMAPGADPGDSRKEGFAGESPFAPELAAHPEYKLSYITAVPRMAKYMEVSSQIYQVYLRHIAPEDIHVYSIDEVMIDATNYLGTYGMTGRELAAKMIAEVYEETGITATAGIGTNLYLCKVAMDIEAKHAEPDELGVRMAELDEMSYREKLWNHRPLTDFWRVGRGIARKLESYGIFTMGDVARCSLTNEELLYRAFGVNAELLIDHAWGWEPCTMDLIKAYKPENNSFSAGQVLQCPYDTKKARVVVHEMADAAALDLVERRMVTNQVVLTVGYDMESLTNPEIRRKYRGEVTKDWYGRSVPKHAHGTANLDHYTSSSREITEAVLSVYDRTVHPDLLVRRLTVVVNHVLPEEDAKKTESGYEQMDLFTDYEALERQRKAEEEKRAKERKLQEAMLDVRKKFGKNAVIKGINMEEGATGRERNRQVGGHKA